MLIDYHRNMLGDRVRNAAFHRALQQVIRPGETRVADIGSGTGFLGFLASRLGAKEVYLYEQAGIMGVSERLARRNRIKNCHFFHEHSTAIIDPPRVDVVISETLGNYAYEENIIETLEDAKRFLAPGGLIIPGRIAQFIAPAVSARFHEELSVWDTVGFDLDFTPAKTLSLNNLYVRTFGAADLLDEGASARCWDTVDFNKKGKNKNPRRGRIEWTLPRDVTVYGFAAWWECELVPGVTLTTHPLAPRTHWEQLYFPVLEPVAGKRGDTVTLDIASSSGMETGASVRWRIGHSASPRVQRLDMLKGYVE